MLAHRAQLGQVELQPDHEHEEHDAELAQVADALGVLRQCQRMRADQHAGSKVAEHRRQPEDRQTTTPITAASRYISVRSNEDMGRCY